MIFTHRPHVSFARFSFCWWRHNKLPMTTQWPDNWDAITWIGISNSLDNDFMQGDIHGRSCKNIDKCIIILLYQQGDPCTNSKLTIHPNNKSNPARSGTTWCQDINNHQADPSPIPHPFTKPTKSPISPLSTCIFPCGHHTPPSLWHIAITNLLMDSESTSSSIMYAANWCRMSPLSPANT